MSDDSPDDSFADLEDDSRDDPFADLEDDSPDDSFEEAFESVDVDEVPVDDVWAAIEGTEADEDPVESPEVGGGDVAVGATAEPVGDGEHLVPKDDYCGRCPYLAVPPDLACDHEGTTIVAVEGDEKFRVRDCPMVERGGVSEE